MECAVFVAKYIVVPLPTLPAIRSESQDADVELVPRCAGAEGHAVTTGNVGSGTFGTGATDLIFRNMLPCALGLPHLIAQAHSVRFGSQKDCLILLERAMLHCNKMVVYLEETRDIADIGVPFEKFAELIKKYLYIRQKILNLQRSWKKYMSSQCRD